jgi:peptidoglycan/xylan/chitin deacetylase (PgdA/CDA1 family)
MAAWLHGGLLGMIYVRDDDVLLKRMAHKDAHAEFMNVHDIIEKYGYIHCPAILTKDIEEFPQTIAAIKQKTAEGKMIPQLHGSSHIDYANLTETELVRDYNECQEWFLTHLGVRYTKHYTPWGAGGRRKDGTPMTRGTLIAPTAKSMGIEVVDMYKPLDPRHIIADKEMNCRELWNKYNGRTIFLHWWYSPELLNEALQILKEAEQ